MPKILGVHDRNKSQIKFLASPFLGIGTITGLGFNNLVIGKTYKLTVYVNSTPNTDVRWIHNGVAIVRVLNGSGGTSSVGNGDIFTATATTITVSNLVNTTVQGDGAATNSYAILEEILAPQIVIEWT